MASGTGSQQLKSGTGTNGAGAGAGVVGGAGAGAGAGGCELDGRPARESSLAAQIDAAGRVLFELVQQLSPSEIPIMWAPEVMDAFARVERSAAAGRLLMISRAAQAPTWKREGFSSAAEWVAFKHGTTVGRAREELATSELLPGLEATSEALRSGQVSPEAAAAIAGAAAINPEAEEDLIDLADQESLRKLREEAARRKAEAESEEAKRAREARVRRERRVEHWVRDGAGFLKATGPIADIAELVNAIEDAVSVKFRQHGTAVVREGHNAAAFDALLGFARESGDVVGGVVGGASAADVDAADVGGPADADGDADGRAPKKRRAPRPDRVVMIRVDLAALLRGSVSSGELCEIAGFGPISVTEARRLLSDSVLAMVLANGEAVVDVVNLSRRPTVAQRFAETFNNPHCAVRGCNRTVAIEFDHRADWAKTYRTTLPDLDRLCSHHHDLKTYQGWTLDPGVGRRKMWPPDRGPGAHDSNAPGDRDDPDHKRRGDGPAASSPASALPGEGTTRLKDRRTTPLDDQQERLLL